MSNRLNTHLSHGLDDVGTNSAVFQSGDFISLSAGFAIAATSSSYIEGVSNQTVTFASDNQTVAQAKLSYVPRNDLAVYTVAISGGTINNTKEGRFYNLTDARTVDGTSEATVSAVVNTSDAGAATDPVIYKQLKLIKYRSATLGDFILV